MKNVTPTYSLSIFWNGHITEVVLQLGDRIMSLFEQIGAASLLLHVQSLLRCYLILNTQKVKLVQNLHKFL